MSKAIGALIIPLIYMVVVLVLGHGKWTKSLRLNIDDFYKVSAGAAFPLVFLGLAGGYHSSFAIPGSMGFVYSHGIGWIANGLWTLFVAGGVMMWLAPRINYLARKNNYLTPGDLVAEYFDNSDGVRIATAIATISFSVGYMFTNVIGPAILISTLTNNLVTYDVACFVIILVVASYVWRAGIRGTMWTTVLQACWMFVVVYVAAAYCTTLVGGIKPMMAAMKEHYIEYLTIPGPKGFLTNVTWFSWAAIAIGLGGALKPVTWSFFYSARKPKEAMKIGYTIPFYLAGIYIPVVFIGFAALLIVPGLTGVSADNSFPKLLYDYAPAWFGGLIIAGAMGAGMSTLDAETNISSCIFISDIYKRYIAPGKDERHYLIAGRWSIVVLAIITYIFTHYRFSIVAIIATLVNAIVALYAPTVILILSKGKLLKSIKITAAGYICGMITGGALLIYLNFISKVSNPLGWHYSAWVLATNVIVMLLVSQFTKGPSVESKQKFEKSIDELYIKSAPEEVSL
ncbi:MAG: hypothetical protein HPY66_1234 [Firmicutes bacterium]|nr:hypothetical protein [Bacillota bacterium]